MLSQHGYPGALYPVNPRHTELRGLRVFPSIATVPGQVDLALVAVPAPLVAGVLEECAAAGGRYAVVVSSGCAAIGAQGPRVEDRIAEVTRRSQLRAAGPNAERCP